MRSLLSSISVQFGAVVTLMAATTAAALIIGHSILGDIADELDVLAGQRAAEARAGAELILATEGVRAGLTTLLESDDAQGAAAGVATVKASLEEINALKEGVPTAAAETIDERRADMLSDLRMLEGAHLENLSARAEIADEVTALNTLIEDFSARIRDVLVEAATQAKDAGDRTVANVETALNTLIETDVEGMQAVLTARAELNLAAGAVIALSQNPDAALRSILLDIASAALDNVADPAETLRGREALREYGEGVAATAASLVAMLESGAFRQNEALALRRDMDVLLASAVDDILFSLAIAVSDTVDSSRGAVSDLITTQQQRMRDLSGLETASLRLMTAALEAAAATDAAALETSRARVDQAAEEVLKLVSAAPELAADIDVLLLVADPDSGVVAQQARALAASSEAHEAAVATSADATALARAARDAATDALNQIGASSAMLTASIDDAKTEMNLIGAGAAVLTLLVQVVAFLLIARPIRTLSAETERLASGDLSKLRISAGAGEVGRMAAALAVFRDNSLEKIRLQEEERETARRMQEETERRAREDQERAEAEAARAAAEAKREAEEAEQRRREAAEREAAERRAEAEREAEKKAHEAEAAARAEKARQAAEAEREAHASRQQLVVEALARGLGRLARGDLGVQIEDRFPEDYERLRSDFNLTVASLRDALTAVIESTAGLAVNADGIDASAERLSVSTEAAAASLAESAAAVRNLTASIGETAESSGQARAAAGDAEQRAAAGGETVAKVVAAMNAIKESSAKIESITAMIEDISFQTNLLSLNAGVEAARAGESGRGFAVVASEVRALAGRASEAVAEINTLIRDSVGEIDAGVDLVNEAGDALTGISAAITDVSSRIADIASQADHQAKEIKGVNTTIAQLDDTTQRNAATAEETTAASKQMREVVGEMQDAVARFQIDQAGSRSHAA